MKIVGSTGRAAIAYIVLAGTQRGVPLIMLPFISQVMEPADYGAASLLTASSLLLTTVLAAPLEALVIRTASRSDSDDPSLLRAMAIHCYLFMPLLLGISAAIVALLGYEILGISGNIWAIELMAVGFQPAMTYFALPVVQARQQLSTFAWLASMSIVLMAGSKLVLVLWLQLGVTGWVLSDLLSAMASAFLAFTSVRPPRALVTPKTVRTIVRFAIPLIPHRTSFWAITSLSRPVMAMVSSLTQVGLLSLGLNIASVANLFLSETNRAVMPKYSRETFPAPTSMTSRIVGFQLALACAGPALVASALALTGQWIFAEAYWPAFKLTGILLIGQAALGLYVIPSNYLVQAAGSTKPIALASSIGGVVMFIALVTFGNRYGAIAAAYATTGGFITMTAVAAGIALFLRLDVAWRTWARCWPEVGMGALALAGGVKSLTFDVGSTPGRLLGALSFAVAMGALLVSTRRRQLQ